jgi:hypothetical protein
LGDKARSKQRANPKLVPSHMTEEDEPEAKQAREHINTLHGHFKAAKHVAEQKAEMGGKSDSAGLVVAARNMMEK